MIAELVRQADILSRATSEPVTGREPFRKRPVHWLLELDEDGNALGITPTTGGNEKKDMRGKQFSITKVYLLGSPNQSNWEPDLLSGPADEIFRNGINEPLGILSSSAKEKAKNIRAKRAKFIRLVRQIKRSLPKNKNVAAIYHFLQTTKRLVDIPDTPQDTDGLKCFEKGETLAFRVAGNLVLNDKEIRAWWEKTFYPYAREARLTEKKEKLGNAFCSQGRDFVSVSDTEGELAPASLCVMGNVPLVSFGNAPFCSYGLGAQTATLKLETMEKASAALNAMLSDDNHHLYMDDQVAVFWANKDNDAVDSSFIRLINSDDPLAVSDFLKSPWAGKKHQVNMANFSLVLLEKGTGRFAVKSWETGTLAEIEGNFKQYFNAIESCLGIKTLASCTIPPKGKIKPAGHVYTSILNAALKGTPLESTLLQTVVRRQAIEFAKGCDNGDAKESHEFNRRFHARIALLKLYFHLNQIQPMADTTDPQKQHPAFLCGRVLALLDKIHNIAHNNSTASSPAFRYYGSASSTPALVLPRLRKLAAIHLDKIGGGLAAILQKGVPKENAAPPCSDDFEGLDQIIARFGEEAKWPRTLSLEDQGRFAIGFHYERARKWPKYRKIKQDADTGTEIVEEEIDTPV